MYIITIGDNENEENYQVYVEDMQQLTEVLDYVKMSPQLELFHVDHCYLALGLEGLKEIISENEE